MGRASHASKHINKPLFIYLSISRMSRLRHVCLLRDPLVPRHRKYPSNPQLQGRHRQDWLGLAQSRHSLNAISGLELRGSYGKPSVRRMTQFRGRKKENKQKNSTTLKPVGAIVCWYLPWGNETLLVAFRSFAPLCNHVKPIVSWYSQGSHQRKQRHHFETMVGSITFVGIYLGETNQTPGFLSSVARKADFAPIHSSSC